MDPAPDFGYDTYKGCGRLKGKVGMLWSLWPVCQSSLAYTWCQHAPAYSKRMLRLAESTCNGSRQWDWQGGRSSICEGGCGRCYLLPL